MARSFRVVLSRCMARSCDMVRSSYVAPLLLFGTLLPHGPLSPNGTLSLCGSLLVSWSPHGLGLAPAWLVLSNAVARSRGMVLSKPLAHGGPITCACPRCAMGYGSGGSVLRMRRYISPCRCDRNSLTA